MEKQTAEIVTIADGGGRDGATGALGGRVGLVPHPEALAFDDDGFRAVQHAVQDGRRDAGIVVEDAGPVLVG